MRCLGVVGLMVVIAVGAAWAQEPKQSGPAEEAYQAGLAAKRAGDLEGALTELERAVMVRPDYGDAWWVLAWVRVGLRLRDSGAEAFAKAAALLPEDDPRKGQAAAKAVALQAELAAAPTGPRRPVETVEPEIPRFALLSGWPLAMLLLAGVACGTAALRVRLLDERAGRNSPAGRFVTLCAGAARGDAKALEELLDLAQDATAQRRLGPHLGLAAALAASRSPEARATLAQTLRSADGPAQLVAAAALAAQEEQPDSSIWLPLLESPVDELRGHALDALLRQPHPDALGALQAIGLGVDLVLAPKATRAVGLLPGPAAAGSLVEICRDGRDGAARQAAAEALAQREDLPERAVRGVAELVLQPGAPEPLALVQALARAGEGGRDALLQLTLDRREPLRVAAREALLDNAHGHFAAALPVAAEPLCQALEAEPERMTCEALEVLVAWVPEASVRFLEAALHADPSQRDDAWTLRAEAVRHLARSADDQATGVLLRALRRMPLGRAADVAAAAHRLALYAALADRGAAEAIPVLLERAAIDRDDAGALATAGRLAERSGAGEALADVAAHGPAKIRRLAIAVLADHPHPEAADALLTELRRAGTSEGDWASVERAATALGRIGDKRGLEPLRALCEQHQELRSDRLDVALALLGDPAALARVEGMLLRDSVEGRRAAADYYRRFDQIPPRAAVVVREAEAHRRAAELLPSTPAERLGDALAALGSEVVPTLRAWLFDGVERGACAQALTLLGDTDALVLGGTLDRVDELIAQDEEPAARLELAAMILEEAEPVPSYVAARLGLEAYAELTASATDQPPEEEA